ncbi:hypothetical protein JOQ06_009228 [Pogonophryne albipinna]|uniref:C2H2-type domain-containing protein n=1 Tax=Pogonophryne albipinna TaxID=1090488 RepID=A0AAD6FVP7_9TELE|nr:hypothetical protein JOQ06_009228 [Pogonophryne albipinna]
MSMVVDFRVEAFALSLAAIWSSETGPALHPGCVHAGRAFGSLHAIPRHSTHFLFVSACAPDVGDDLGKAAGIVQPALSQHRERSVASSSKDCAYCGKSFRTSHHLKVHLRIHTGQRPFRCSYCPYGASQKGNLKTHVLCVHRMPFDNSQYPDRRFKRSRTESEVSEKNPDEAVGDAQPMNGAESNDISVEGEANSRNQE